MEVDKRPTCRRIKIQTDKRFDFIGSLFYSFRSN